MNSVDEKAAAGEEATETKDKPISQQLEEVGEVVTPVQTPIENQSGDVEDDDDESVGYEESAERDEIIRERINRTQESMR